MIQGKPLKTKGFEALRRLAGTTPPELRQDAASIPSRIALDSDLLDSPSRVTELTNPIEIIKDKTEIILDSLSLFPETGLNGNIIYSFIREYHRKNDLKVPERDVVYNCLRRMTDKKVLERFKRDNVWWYRLIK